MPLAELLANSAFPRALVVGAFGGAGLALSMLYSRRGPLIYPVYAATLAARTLLLPRYPSVSHPARFAVALAGFVVASVVVYIAVGIRAGQERERLWREGRLPATGGGIPVLGHVWRLGFLLAVGAVVSAGVAFVAA